MDFLDKMALWGRKYEPLTNPRTGGREFSLRELLEAFNFNTILELTPIDGGKPGQTYRPDAERKLKLSILDEGISHLPGAHLDRYEIHSTAPSSDFARIKVVAFSPSGGPGGELRMLVAQRMPELYFQDDPIFATLLDAAKQQPAR